MSRFTLGIAYSYILPEGRQKWHLLGTNGGPLPEAFQANGLYRSDVHSLALSLSCHF